VKPENLKTLLTFVGLLGGAWIIYEIVLLISKKIPDVQQAAASDAVDALQSVIGSGIVAPGQTYTVTMPDGSQQTVTQSAQAMQPMNGLGMTPCRARRVTLGRIRPVRRRHG